MFGYIVSRKIWQPCSETYDEFHRSGFSKSSSSSWRPEDPCRHVSKLQVMQICINQNKVPSRERLIVYICTHLLEYLIFRYYLCTYSNIHIRPFHSHRNYLVRFTSFANSIHSYLKLFYSLHDECVIFLFYVSLTRHLVSVNHWS
jgi:hypothetical protein